MDMPQLNGLPVQRGKNLSGAPIAGSALCYDPDGGISTSFQQAKGGAPHCGIFDRQDLPQLNSPSGFNGASTILGEREKRQSACRRREVKNIRTSRNN